VSEQSRAGYREYQKKIKRNSNRRERTEQAAKEQQKRRERVEK
jgi:hypothetical protein